MKRVSSIIASLAILAAVLAPAASGAPGDLDPNFGNGGSERLLPSEEKVVLPGIAIQPDGKIVLAGSDQTSNGVIVVRLLPNGAVDPSFGNGGIVLTPFPVGSFGEGRAVAIQPDGKIVVVGSAKGAVDGDFLAIRYLDNGALDPSFGGGDGIEIVPVGLGQDRAEAVVIGANERILLSGEARLPENKGVEAGVVVLQTGGKPDPSFNATGVKTLKTTAGEPTDEGKGIAEQPDGKIVIADETGNGAGNGFTIVRLLASGGLDPEFNGTGFVNTPIPGNPNPGAKGRATDVLVQPDGRIVASGYGFDEVAAKFDSKFAAVRYLPKGELDKSFGAGGSGIFTQQVGTGEDSARTLIRTPAGKLYLAGGYDAAPGNSSLALMRLDPSGVLDPTFGAGGIAVRGLTAPFGNTYEDAALDARERVTVVSRDFIGGGNTEIEVSRFLGDVPPDPPPATTSSPPQYTPAPVLLPPHARMKAVPRKLEATKLTGFFGTANAPAGGKVAKVQIALVKAASAKAGGAATCQELANAKGRFKTVKAVRGNCSLLWLNARGTEKWNFVLLKTVLPPGRYVVYSRAVDAAGVAEETFSRAAGNRFSFRLLAPEPGSALR